MHQWMNIWGMWGSGKSLSHQEKHGTSIFIIDQSWKTSTERLCGGGIHWHGAKPWWHCKQAWPYGWASNTVPHPEGAYGHPPSAMKRPSQHIQPSKPTAEPRDSAPHTHVPARTHTHTPVLGLNTVIFFAHTQHIWTKYDWLLPSTIQRPWSSALRA